MEHIKKINVSMVLLVVLSIRMLFSDASLAQSIFALGLVALFAYSKFLNSKKVKPLDEEIKEELNKMKNSISGLAVRSGLKPPSDPNLKVW